MRRKKNFFYLTLGILVSGLLLGACAGPNSAYQPPQVSHIDPVSGRTWTSYGEVDPQAVGPGQTSIFGVSEFQVGQKSNLSVEYAAAPPGLPIGAQLALVIPSVEWGVPQTQNPMAPCLVKVRRSDDRPAQLMAVPEGFGLTPSRTGQVVLAKIVKAPLAPGAKLRFDLFAFQVQKIAGDAPFPILVDPSGTGHFAQVAGDATVRVRGGKSVFVRTRLPYFGKPGEVVEGHIVPLDKFGNLAGSFPEIYNLKIEGDAKPEIQQVKAGPDGLTAFSLHVGQSGVIHVKEESNPETGGSSNPLVVSDETPEWNFYMGDAHSHTGVSDGYISSDAEASFKYARDIALLDFAGVTDHAEAIWGDAPANAQWGKAAQITRQSNAPGKFVTLPGFEWTGNFPFDQLYPIGPGHLTVLRLDDEVHPVRADAEQKGGDTEALIKSQKQYGGQIFFHHSAVQWGHADFDDPITAHTNVIEIYSSHGCSLLPECQPSIGPYSNPGWTVQAALARGYELGFVASTDNHQGRPGTVSFPGNERLSMDAGGRTMVLAKELTREAVLDAYAQRRTYATNGAQILLWFSAGDAPMGCQLPVSSKPLLKARAVTQDPAEVMELVRYQPGDPIPFPVLMSVQPSSTYELNLSYQVAAPGPALYYVHVREKGGGEAWSSPIYLGDLPRRDYVDPQRPGFSHLLSVDERRDMAQTAAPVGHAVEVARMPDTLDLAGRIELGLQHLVTNLDAMWDGIPFFAYDFSGADARVMHANWDYGDLCGRYGEALLLARTVTGSSLGLSREKKMRSTLLGTFNTDGLTYRLPTFFSDFEADIFDQGSAMSFLVEAFKRTQDPRWLNLVQSQVRGLSNLTKKTPHGLKFAHPTYLPGGGVGPARNNWDHADPGHHAGRLLDPLADYLALSNDPTAAQLFDGLAQYVIQDSGVFAADGRFDGHVHSRTLTLLGLLKHALAHNDEKTIELVRSAYDFLKTKDPGFGWFPEVIDPDRPNNPGVNRAETDVTADMVSLALWLAQRDAKYWDDVELFTRNQLAAAQLINPAALLEGKGDPEHLVARSALGAFCGRCEVGGWGLTSQDCCSPAGVKALYRVWRGMTREANGTLYVYLALNHVDELAVIKSYEPYSGRVEIIPAKPMNLIFRLPEGVDQKAVKFGGCRRGAVDGRFLKLDECAAGAVAFIEYPLRQTTISKNILGKSYQLTWKGKTLLKLEPAGHGPAYQHAAQGAAPVAERKYFLGGK